MAGIKGKPCGCIITQLQVHRPSQLYNAFKWVANDEFHEKHFNTLLAEIPDAKQLSND